ncbi:hypothetical protein EDC04DRAFT_2898217 [Pisolithus marmoratus]|nr:hypothetical protein EDC04DRAFT_2898217 [Pisolithus marmoratus]
MDLLKNSLNIYDCPPGLDNFHLPQPTANPPTLPDQDSLVPKDHEGGVRRGEETSIGLPMDGLPEAPPRIPMNSPCTADCGHEDVVPPHEETTNAGDTSTQDTPHSDARASRPPTGAGDPPQALSNASWRSWNPGHPVITPCSSEKLDAAQRAVRNAAAEQRRVKQQAMNDAVAELLEEQDIRINEITKAHCILPEKGKLLITGESHYQNQHEESLANTLVCVKVHQVNADCPPGQKFQLKELQEMVTNDPDMQNLDEEMKQKYLGELKESHGRKAMGVRSTNTVASRDVQATLKKIYKELQALTYLTGIYACLFITRGHVYDTHAMTWFGTDNIMDFWEDWMNLSPDYIIKQLELWACNEEKNINACDSLENMQKQAKNGLDSSFSISLILFYILNIY